MPDETGTNPRFAAMIEDIRCATASEVQQGPFKGMTISEVTSWYGGDVVQKLIGSYELELWGWVEEAIAGAPNLVVNIGCAEGYYAVGLAMRLPSARVHAIDIDFAALKACEATARANRAEEHLRLELGWSKASIQNILRQPGKSLLFIDCEGCEAQMFDLLEPNTYEAAEIIVECHDFEVPGISELLMTRLSRSHETRILRTSERKVEDFPILAGRSPDLVAAALSESRPGDMTWIYAKPKA